MSEQKSTDDFELQSIELPVKRTTGNDLEEILTSNAYHNVLPARYLQKDEDGNVVEEPDELFERVAKNVALADAVYQAEEVGYEIEATPDDIKPDASDNRRDDLSLEVFGVKMDAVEELDTEPTVTVTDENLYAFAYDTIIPKLPDDVVEIVEDTVDEFYRKMTDLSFMPNSPTLMNAGDDFQQLSACFVNSPTDDIENIHETAKEAALTFQSGGGMGYAFTHLRPYGDRVGSTGGIASGPISFMRTFDQMCGTIAQGGKRRGAQMGILRVDHPDIIQFLHAKDKDVSLTETLHLNDPDDFTHNSFGEALEEARELIETDEDGIERVPEHLRNAAEGHLSNFNISVGVTDDFMEAVENDEEYTLINPRTDEPYIANEKTEELYGWFNLGDNVEAGEELSMPAREIWNRIAEGAWDNGEPGVIFLERANKMHTFDVEEHPEHEIHATNPCVTGNTNVLLANGESKQISELAREDEQFQVEAIDNDGSITRSTAEAFKTKSNAETLEVSFANNTSVQMTPDHRIRTDSGWVEAQDIDDDASVRTPEGYTKVVSVKESEVADVYDLSVSDHHNYMVGEPSAWINVHNCGEQPLEEYEACNLGHINLSTLVSQDTPDWRAFESDGDLDDQVNEFLDRAIDWDELNSRIEIGTHFLENVVTMSDFPVDKITEKVSNNRKIGLGIMGLAQMYVQMGIEYGTDEADEVAKQVMEYINHRSKEVSHNIATGEDVYAERGVFDNWHKSKYADPTEYEEWFEYHTGLDAEEWEDGLPIRNHNTTTIAPTGTTSMIGNTTGGCEPIYQVAYYKNVSGDVQGDEMLVEFDDYFLRTLEANGLNVDDVKREAQEQMSNNEFGGVDSLETVPDEIGELFVTTNQLSAKQHGSVQCALQKGVDSSISKTVNAPSTATVEDAKDTFMQIYKEGGKGVTYYRDGTRSKQVLTTREDNQETESAVDVVKEKVESGEVTLSDLGVKSIDSETETTTEGSTPESRPKSLKGTTKELDTGYGDLYVTINETENDQPFEVFANIGKSGGYTESFTEATARLISLCLRCGIDPEDVIEQIEDIRSPKISWDRGEQVYSVPDGIAVAMRRHIEDDETSIDAEAPTDNSDTESNDVIDAGENPECPSCGGLSLYYSEGCKTCEACGWSEC